MWATYNGRSYSQQGRESEQTSSNVGIDGLAPHDDAVYNKVRASSRVIPQSSFLTRAHLIRSLSSQHQRSTPPLASPRGKIRRAHRLTSTPSSGTPQI